jgi:hypothetical protein
MEEPAVILPTNETDAAVISWQKKLLPWMVILPTALIGVFIFLATVQMRNFEERLFPADRSEVTSTLPPIANTKVDSDIESKLPFIKLYTLTKMEEHSINRRYNQAGAIIMSGIYTKYLGFFTGMILAIVGSVFIISKLKEDTTNLEGSAQEQIKFKVASSSPGIIFSLLGTILMITTILKKGEVNVQDQPLYLNYYNLSKPEANAGGIESMEDTSADSAAIHIDPKKAQSAKP